MTKIKKGTRVTCEVKWPDGRVTTSEGTFLFLNGDYAYVETVFGVVEVDPDTVEVVE